MVHAETTTFGLKILGYLAENKRNIDRLKNSIKQIQTIQMSGPVGTYSNIDTRVEQMIAKKLKFSIEPVSTQIIQETGMRTFLLFCYYCKLHRTSIN